MTEGDRVSWAGNPNPWCAPGEHGTVLAISRKDPNQVKVEWDKRPDWIGTYTWERRKNLDAH